MQKENLPLTVASYQTQNSIPLSFSFPPQPTLDRNWVVTSHCIDGKSLYILNDYFSKKEADELRDFSLTASFSQKIYGNATSGQKGEAPAKMMNGKERWQFFAKPPYPIQKVFSLFSFLGHFVNAKVMTLPWCLSDGSVTSNCLATNFLTSHSKISQDEGKHRDYVPENGLPFSIPCLYDMPQTAPYHPIAFVNGEQNRPLMVTVMVYATAKNFASSYGMGTFFYDQNHRKIHVPCRHMQIVFFEGDLWHTIEQSKIPHNVKSWRISYVFKLIFNPKTAGLDLRAALLTALTHIHS